MGQTTFDDEALFGEAAEEVRADVEDALAAARDSLPDPDDVWAADGDNVLGVLNGLRSSLDPGEAEEHLREARKWYTMGERADAFEDDALAEHLETLEAAVAEMRDAREQVSDLAGTVPELRSMLEDAHGAPGVGDGADGGAAADEEPAETDGDGAGAESDGDAPSEGDHDSDDGGATAADGGAPAEGAEQATLDGEDD